jgi:hypothetical protein
MSLSDHDVSPADLPLAHLSDRELQRMLASAVRAYSGRQQQGSQFPAFDADEEPVVTGTDAVVAAAAILEATNVEIFELGLWRAWGTVS